MKAQLAELIGELTDSGVRFDPDDPGYDAARIRTALAAAVVELPSADRLLWVSMTGAGELVDIDFHADALRDDEERVAAGLTATIRRAEQAVVDAIAAVRSRQTAGSR